MNSRAHAPVTATDPSSILMSSRRGRFITLEGIDGAGKSTHVAWLADEIARHGHTVVATREPGGTPLGESLRALLLEQTMTRDSEALLMFAARIQHVEHVIRPALARGDWVLCDRFTDATYAYQSGGHGVSPERIRALEQWIPADCRPDLTLLFDVPTGVSRRRLDVAQTQGRELDRFERETGAFFERVRNAYRERARAEPDRFRVIDSTRLPADVRAELAAHIESLHGASR
jgi:dTMP kinase